MIKNIYFRISLDINTQYTYYKNSFKYKSVANPLKTLIVPINEIKYKLYDSKIMRKYSPGEIINGDWDLRVRELKTDYEENEKHKGLVEHFKYGIPWEETILFRARYTRKLKQKGRYLGCTSLEEIAKKYQDNIDPLYSSIKEKGIVTRSIKNPFIDPLYVHIGRDGDFIYTTGGNHRLSIAFMLGIEYMPVRIWLRHRKWQDIRDELYTGVSNGDERKISLLKNHPDIQDILKNNKWLRNGKD
jgi:hypothetical protein